jgi:ABC-type sugar transport system permease subunit
MFNQGFESWHIGQGAAVAFVLFGLTLIGALIQLRLRPERTEGGA